MSCLIASALSVTMLASITDNSRLFSSTRRNPASLAKNDSFFCFSGLIADGTPFCRGKTHFFNEWLLGFQGNRHPSINSFHLLQYHGERLGWKCCLCSPGRSSQVFMLAVGQWRDPALLSHCWTTIMMLDNIFSIEIVLCENTAISKTQCTHCHAVDILWWHCCW